MKAILSPSHRAVLLGALLLTLSPPAADGSPTGTSEPGGSRRQVVLQVRGGS
jgi:hypothetical protein